LPVDRAEDGDEDFTALVNRAEAGDEQAKAAAMRAVYDELHALAVRRMSRVPTADTLQPTALVHEAWIRMVGSDRRAPWASRRHFVSWSARAMHDIVVEQARRHTTAKRGAGYRRLSLGSDLIDPETWADDILDLSDALAELSRDDPSAAEVVRLRFFAGLTHDEVAQAMDWPVIRVRREWSWAKAWLHRRLGPTDSPNAPPNEKS
jgi:RNA polymerase sigma factor (TIGR02999 family)